MLSLFKKLFTKSPAATAAAPAAVAVRAQASPESAPALPRLEVANLSLAAIVKKFPEELRPLVLIAPPEGATVALPVPTIVKQLATGAVRISLATLHRQAPAGIFAPLPAGDKRTVEVPLQEIFKHVNPAILKRRPEQKPFDLPSDAVSLFGDRSNPMAIVAPTDAPVQEAAIPQAPSRNANGLVPPPSILKPGVIAAPQGLDSRPAAHASPHPAPANGAPREVPKHAEPPTAQKLALPLAKLVDGWPDAIRAEVAALDPASQVEIPASEITAGLARGRVALSWGQLYASILPAPAVPTAADPSTELVLPLKIVAPAFLTKQKPQAAARKTAAVDESIPALFNPGKSDAPAPPAAPVLSIAAPVAPVAPPALEIPAPPIEKTAIIPQAAPVLDPQPAPAPVSVGEVFGEPARSDWSPMEIVARVAKLPGTAGAMVALGEGLDVAHVLPEGIKPESVAAFLPQIFGRLNQYSGEMQLGEVAEVTLTTSAATCHIFSIRSVFFAAFSKPGESLPLRELRVVATHLANFVQH